MLSADVNNVDPSVGAFEENVVESSLLMDILYSKGMVLIILSAATVIFIISKKAKKSSGR